MPSFRAVSKQVGRFASSSDIYTIRTNAVNVRRLIGRSDYPF